jgi:nucleoside-diphosphate-sugar epimerase
VSSPSSAVAGLIAVYEADRDALRGRLALNLPALNMRVGDMLDALEQVAGPKVRQRVRFERDARIAGIVANWPTGASAERANSLGLRPDDSFADIIRQYIDDCRQRPNADQTLKGLDA